MVCAYLGDDICSMWLFTCAAQSTLAAVLVVHVGFYQPLYSCTDKSIVLYLDNASSTVVVRIWVMISGCFQANINVRIWEMISAACGYLHVQQDQL